MYFVGGELMSGLITETPHTIKVYEETSDGLVRRRIGIYTVFTRDHADTPPEERNTLSVEVQT